MAQAFSEKFYKSKAWQRCRSVYSASVGGLCEDCLERGLYKPGRIVHHMIPLTTANIDRPEVTLAWSNLRLLCMECHRERHKKAQMVRYHFDANGNVIPPC